MFDNNYGKIMATTNIKSESVRLETRLTKEQKNLFIRATRIGGYSSLTDFIIKTAREKADKIIAESEQILASKRDSEIFYDAITNPPKPNKELKQAVKEYKKLISE